MDVLVFLTPLVVGFTASAEFASFAFVHPVIRRLDSGDHIRVEQGLLRTFGRVMPVLMPLSVVATVAYAVAGDGGGGNALRCGSRAKPRLMQRIRRHLFDGRGLPRAQASVGLLEARLHWRY